MLPKLAIAHSRHPILLLDCTGKVVVSSRGATELLGVKSQQLDGKAIYRLFTAAPEVAKGLEKIAASGWSGQVSCALTRSSNRYQFELLPVQDGSGDLRGFLGELSAANPAGFHDSGPRRETLESIGRMAGGIAHDLNNILTGILGHISYLRLANCLDNVPAESVAAIEDGARRAATMTHQILGFARGETAAMSSVNLSDVVAAGLNLLRAVVPENIELVSKALARDLWVIGDDSQISQLVLNLAVNARDALPEGGKIEISAERLELTQPKTLLHSDGKPAGKLDAGHYAKLVIRDNGTGIPESVRHRIFEPFFTTKSRRGTGLGLANVVSIVKAHSGVITVRSDEGKGTQFSVYLPALKGVPEESAQSSNQAGRPVPVGRERILVVDDEEAVRTVMQRCLEHLGYEVEVAASGAEAIARYAEDIKRFRLVILDMMMPQMSGDEVFLKLQTLNSEVGVLIASGYSSDVRTRRVLDSGGLGFIQKPFAVDDLAREVRRCLDSL